MRCKYSDKDAPCYHYAEHDDIFCSAHRIADLRAQLSGLEDENARLSETCKVWIERFKSLQDQDENA